MYEMHCFFNNSFTISIADEPSANLLFIIFLPSAERGNFLPIMYKVPYTLTQRNNSKITKHVISIIAMDTSKTHSQSYLPSLWRGCKILRININVRAKLLLQIRKRFMKHIFAQYFWTQYRIYIR